MVLPGHKKDSPEPHPQPGFNLQLPQSTLCSQWGRMTHRPNNFRVPRALRFSGEYPTVGNRETKYWSWFGCRLRESLTVSERRCPLKLIGANRYGTNPVFQERLLSFCAPFHLILRFLLWGMTIIASISQMRKSRHVEVNLPKFINQ